MSARVEAERAIADVLAEHREVVSEDGGLSEGCLCPDGPEFDWFPDRDEMHKRYVAHVASVLADLMAEKQAEAWDECSDLADDRSPSGVLLLDEANPYRPHHPKDTQR